MRHLRINRYRSSHADAHFSLALLAAVRYLCITNRIRKHLPDSSDLLVTPREEKKIIEVYRRIETCVIVFLSLCLSIYISLFIHLLVPSKSVRSVDTCVKLLSISRSFYTSYTAVQRFISGCDWLIPVSSLGDKVFYSLIFHLNFGSFSILIASLISELSDVSLEFALSFLSLSLSLLRVDTIQQISRYK